MLYGDLEYRDVQAAEQLLDAAQIPYLLNTEQHRRRPKLLAGQFTAVGLGDIRVRVGIMTHRRPGR